MRDADGTFRSPPAESAAALYGLGYRLWSPSANSEIVTDNVRFLEAEWSRSQAVFPEDDVARLLDAVRARPGVTLDTLVAELSDCDLVYWAIYRARVFVDLRATYLSHRDRVLVFESASAAQVWRAAVASVDATGSGFSASEVLERSMLARFPKEALQVALDRYRVLRPFIESGAPASHLTGPRRLTHTKWLNDYRRAQRECGVGLVGLCPKWHQAGNRTMRFPAATLELMDSVAFDEYETARNVSAKAAHAVLMDRCLRAGVPFPSYPTYLRYLKSRDRSRSIARRRGRKEAAAQAPPTGPRNPAVVGQGPLDTAHVDHTLLDVSVRYGPLAHQVLERPWFTPVQCPWSRCVLGYALSFEPPGVYAVFAALRDVFNRQERLPNRLVADRGAEFGSVALEQLCAAARMEKVDRPPGRPRFGAVIERLFHTVNTQFVHLLSGNTQLLKDPRRMSREVDPRRDAIWSLGDLDAFLERFLFKDYPTMPHSGLKGMTPRERFEQGVATIGSGRVLGPSEQADLRFLLWPPARRRPTVNHRKGIVVDCVRYWHESMRSADVAGSRVDVRVDPDDSGYVAAYIAGTWRVCRSEHFETLHGRSRRELRLATLVLRKLYRDEGQRQPVRAHRLAALLRDVRAHEELERQRLRDEEHRKLRERAGLRDAASLSDGSAIDAPAPPEEPFWDASLFDDLDPGTEL